MAVTKKAVKKKITTRILGYVVIIGSGMHKKLLAQKKYFDDLNKQ